MSRNFAVILFFIAFTTYEKTSLIYRVRGSEFYELLFGLVKFSGLLRNARLGPVSRKSRNFSGVFRVT